MPNRLGIPEIEPEAQIAKGVDKDLRDYFAVNTIGVAVQHEVDPSKPGQKILEEINRESKKRYPDGPTLDMLGAGSSYELYVNAHQQRRAKIFRVLGVTTLALLEQNGSPYSLDYLKSSIINESGLPRVRTAWDYPLEIPQQYLDMFELKPPADDEVAVRESRAI